MQKKVILLATFTTHEYLENFLYKLYKQFGVKKKSVFLFETDNEEIILTYRLFLNFDEKINIRKELPKTVQIHKKGTTFFTINALNKLIETEYDLPKGNVNYSSYEIDWSKYENTMISLRNNNLEILPLNKKIME
tara:strand:+ start:2413 stop:2817 length:405 start_codon:yes stop_codon:yes gene_type:complete